MPAPRTREETSAGGVVYRMISGVAHFLLIRDSYQNWGFPKGHLKRGEPPDRAALRETAEETGLAALELRDDLGEIEWWFRFRGRRVHKRCRFYLIESREGETKPQVAEGITACVLLTAVEAGERLSYENARGVLERAVELVGNGQFPSKRTAGQD